LLTCFTCNDSIFSGSRVHVQNFLKVWNLLFISLTLSTKFVFLPMGNLVVCYANWGEGRWPIQHWPSLFLGIKRKRQFHVIALLTCFTCNASTFPVTCRYRTGVTTSGG
jgi:hypothetical protein